MTKQYFHKRFREPGEELRTSIIYSLGIFVLFIILYGADMFHFSLVGDELRESMEDVPDIYIAQRRWGTAVWKTLFGYGYLPYLNVIVFSAIQTITVLFQLEIYGFRMLFAKVVYGMVYCACPVWHSLIGISHLTDVFALSMLCSTLVVYALSREGGVRSMLLATMMMMAAMSIYQTSVFYVATLWMAWYVSSCVRGKAVSFFKSAFKLSVAVIIGWGICFGVSCVLRRSGLASLEVLHMIGNYQSEFSNGVRQLLQNCSLPDVSLHVGRLLMSSIEYALGIMCVNGDLFSYSHIYYACGGMMAVLFCLFNMRNKRCCGVVFAALLFVLILPYAAYVLSCGTMTNLRMYMGTGVSVACMWALVAENSPTGSRLRRVLPAVLCLLLLKGAYTYTQKTRDVAWYAERTKLQFLDIRDAAREVAQRENLSGYKVIWVGDSWEGRSGSVCRALETVDGLFLSGWVQPFAVKNFAAYYGCGRMEWAWSMSDDMAAHVREMPVWPESGSVQRWGNDIVVKVYQQAGVK